MKKIKFCFLIICSENYIQETVGLVRNINKFYPNYKVFVISLDLTTEKQLLKFLKEKVIVISGEKIWGEVF